MVEVLRDRFDRTYPLANAAPYVRASGRRMLWKAQEEAGLPGMFGEEVTGQLLLAPWVEQFVASAQFDEEHEGDVAAWYDLTEDDVRQAVNYDRLHARIA